MPKHGQTKQSIYKDELHFNNVRNGVIALLDPNDKRTQAEIAQTCNVSQSQFSRHAKEYSEGKFPDSYADARAQGFGMSGGDIQLRLFAEENVDTDDTGRGRKSQLFRNFVDRFPRKNAEARRDGMVTVRANIKRLRREREEMAALAEAANYDSSNDSSDDEGGFH